MGDEETARRVRRIIRNQLDVDETRIVPTASFVRDLAADSLGLVELTLALEEEFEIDIPEEDALRLQTVEDAVDYVAARAKTEDG